MSESPDDYDSYERAVERVETEGSMWLNTIFRTKDTPRRLFGKRGPRISKLEVFWGAISALIVMLVLVPGYVYIGDWLFVLFHPVAIAAWTVIAGWNGRKIAHMSPLRRRTGEGTGVWFWIFIKKMLVKISFLINHPVMYNQTLSRAGNNDRSETVVECIDWIGTSRAPRMPYNYDPERRKLQGELYLKTQLPLRGRRVSLTDRQRRRVLEEVQHDR